MDVDAQGWLASTPGGAAVVHVPTVRTTPLVTGAPLGLVWHATGGVGGPAFGRQLAEHIRGYRRDVDRPASWTALIDRAGTLFQSAPFTVGTWHVGRPGVVAGRSFRNVNAATIGVELENAGPAVKLAGATYAYPFWRDRAARVPESRARLPEERVETFDGGLFDAFPEAQVGTAFELMIAVVRHFGWTPDRVALSHAQFAAPRKTDPGALWMRKILPGLLARLQPAQAIDDEPTLVDAAWPWADVTQGGTQQ